MKKIVLLWMLCAAALCQAQWWTATSEGTGLVLCLQWADSMPRLYSPLQTTDPIAISHWELRGDTLTIKCKSIGFSTTLVRQGERWCGTWKQGLMRESIEYLPSDTIFHLRRPQTPTPPFPYTEETIQTDYTDSQGNAVHLEGTLTLPKGRKRVPCMVLVSGSGQQNRDEELMQHRPFAVIADYMARHGIATLRYDDRGVGASTGALDSASTPLFSEDAEAMLKAVKNHKQIDKSHLGIGGHSEGGAIAPMVAARNDAVRFVVMLAGQGCTGREVLAQQNVALFRANGVSERLCNTRGRCMELLMSLPAGSSIKEYQTIIAACLDTLTTAEADSIGLKKGMAYAMKSQMESSWMKAFIALNPADYLPRVLCPILALNGSRDCQVVAEPNLKAIELLTQGRAQCRQIEGLNHLFQPCVTGDPSEYILIEQTFAEEALQMIVSFVNQIGR